MFQSSFHHRFPNNLSDSLSFNSFMFNNVLLSHQVVVGYVSIYKSSRDSTYYLKDMFCIGMYRILIFQHIIFTL
jgi:hypothetical protein